MDKDVRARVLQEYEECLGVLINKDRIKQIAEAFLERELNCDELEQLTDRIDEIYNEDIKTFMPYVLEVEFPDEFGVLEGKKEVKKDELG
jgi:hypothetical protein